MLRIDKGTDGEILLIGRFDASQSQYATSEFETVDSSCSVNFEQLEYISSAGLSVLLVTQKRLMETGDGLRLIKLNKHIHDVFKIAGFHHVFEIDDSI